METILRMIRERQEKENVNKMLVYVGSSLDFARSVRMAAKAISFPEFTNRVNWEIHEAHHQEQPRPAGTRNHLHGWPKGSIGRDVVGVGITPEEAAQHELDFDEYGFLEKAGPSRPAFTPSRLHPTMVSDE